jgi:hypothetical protein
MNPKNPSKSAMKRRTFIKRLGLAGVAALPVGAYLTSQARASAPRLGGALSRGDAAILRFLAAAELIESDLWITVCGAWRHRQQSAR